MAKIIITKQVSQDESLQAEVFGETDKALAENFSKMCMLLDSRLEHMGQRVVEAHGWVQKLPPAVIQAVNAVMGILYGRPGAIDELKVAKEAIDRTEQSPNALESLEAERNRVRAEMQASNAQ
jgi:hypothetical protein